MEGVGSEDQNSDSDIEYKTLLRNVQMNTLPKDKRIKSYRKSKKSRYERKLPTQFLQDSRFISWIDISEQNENHAFCKFCNCEIVGGITQLERHGKTKKHLKNTNFQARVMELITEETNEEESDNGLTTVVYEQSKILSPLKEPENYREKYETVTCTMTACDIIKENKWSTIYVKNEKTNEESDNGLTAVVYKQSEILGLHQEPENEIEEHENVTCTLTDRDIVLQKAARAFSQQEDKFGVFGKYIASELRNMRSEYLQKKMKRKIQEVIVEINQQEEDNLRIELCPNSIPIITHQSDE